MVQHGRMALMDTLKKLLGNKDKLAQGVNKATDVIDQKTGGKHTDKLKKVDEAAAKMAGKKPPEPS
jgi:hypothetical protein